MKKLFFIFSMIVLFVSSSFAYEINEHQLVGDKTTYDITWTNTQRGLLNFQLAYDVTNVGNPDPNQSVNQYAYVFAYFGNIYSPGNNLTAKSYNITGTKNGNGSLGSPQTVNLSYGNYWDHFSISQENWNTHGSFPYVDNWVRIDLF